MAYARVILVSEVYVDLGRVLDGKWQYARLDASDKRWSEKALIRCFDNWIDTRDFPDNKVTLVNDSQQTLCDVTFSPSTNKLTSSLYVPSPPAPEQDQRQYRSGPSFIHPADCTSARLEYAAAIIAECIAALTVETVIGLAALVAAGLAVASAAVDVQNECH